MSGGFSFPPPPPPPPKASWSPPANGEQHPSQDRGRGRGRGGGRGRPHDSSGRGRGRGDRIQDQNHRPNNQSSAGSASQNSHYAQQTNSTSPILPRLPAGSYVNPAFMPHPSHGDPSGNTTSMSPPRTLAGHKRKLDALRPPLEDRKPKPQTAPAVPSFGAPILPPKPVTSDAPKAHVASNVRKSLGLAAKEADTVYSSSEDEKEAGDVDEEALHAGLGTKLTFEHNGVVLTLNNAADLAAWQDERRRKWPTRARMQERETEKRMIGEERRRLLTTTAASKQDTAAADRQIKREAEKARRDSRSHKSASSKVTSTKVPLSDLDRARKELAKQEAKLTALRKQVTSSQAALDDARAREATRNATSRAESPEAALSVKTLDVHQDTLAESETSSVLSESSVVSSDSSDTDSESDDGSPPEVSTTKAPVATTEQRGQRLCRYFATSGYCRDGDACGFRHELAPGAQVPQPRQQQPPREDRPPQLDPSTIGRKSIYQRLMEQQQEEEDRLALKVIKHLGKAGFFAAATDA